MTKRAKKSPTAFAAESQSFSAQFNLSKREYDVVLTLINNITNSEDIAKQLGISTHTVNNHLKSIFDKTETKSKTEVLACFLNFAAARMQQDRLFARPPRVLIVDDEQSICEYVQEGLTERGLKVFTSNNPKNAVRLVVDHNIDVIICDVRMPEMNGMGVLRELRERHQFWPYFIFMTGFADYSVAESLHAGASGYIEKPINMNQLFNLVMENIAECKEEKIQVLEEAPPAKPVELRGTYRLQPSQLGFGGAFVPKDSKMSKHKIGVGSLITMTLAPDKLPRAIQVEARVIWERNEAKDGLEPGIGIKFIKLNESDRDLLMEYIRSHGISSFIPEGLGA